MVNVIWTGDTLAIVWFWQMSNLIYMPYCVSSMAGRKLITFDTLHVLFCSGDLLLVVPFNWIPLSTVRQQVNKQQGVFSQRGCVQVVPSVAKWQHQTLMNPVFSWMSNCANREPMFCNTAASSFSLPLLLLAPLSCCQYGSRAESRLQYCPIDAG